MKVQWQYVSLLVWPGTLLTAMSAGLQRCDRCDFWTFVLVKKVLSWKMFLYEAGRNKNIVSFSGRNNRAALLCQTFSFKKIIIISDYVQLAHSNWKRFFLVIFSCNGIMKCEQFACSNSKSEVLAVKCVAIWIKAFQILPAWKSVHVELQ